jgi:phage FluMu protein Com|tara:strand:- start:174 stop:356 length:183 start_codon:yes stop_codon:yes gene_type:complete
MNENQKLNKLFEELDFIMNMELKCSCPKKVNIIAVEKNIILNKINNFKKTKKINLFYPHY